MLQRVKYSRFGSKLIEGIPVDVGEFSLYLPMRFRGHYLNAPYEPTSCRTFYDVLRPDMTVIDVGAHLGFYTILAAKQVGPRGRVISVEPSQDNIYFLRKNIHLHQLDHVEIHQCAAGRENCLRNFQITGSSDSNGFYEHPLTATVQKVEVHQVCLDDIVDGPVHAVKIDVEGAELEVLEGMSRILAENPHLSMWVEWNPACMMNAGYSPKELPYRLTELGFDVSVIDDHAGNISSLSDTMALVDAGVPNNWYVNLWARRGS